MIAPICFQLICIICPTVSENPFRLNVFAGPKPGLFLINQWLPNPIATPHYNERKIPQ